MNYVYVRDGKIQGSGHCRRLEEGTINIETSDEVIKELDKYIFSEGELVLDPDYEEKAKAKEQDRVNRLTMTPLDLIKAVKTLGVSDEQVEAFLNSNLAIKHELQFCQNVYCGIVKQFLPVEISEGVMLTEELVERLFKVKNGEEQ